MKKLVLAAAALLVATMSLSTSALADGRNGDDEWIRRGHHMDNRDRDFGNRDRGDHDRGDRRMSERHHRDGDDWRRDRWRHDYWRYGWRDRYWGGPSVVVVPSYYDRYCFIKKVRRYDDWGNLYIKRVRVCR